MEQIILDMVADPQFKDYMVMKMDEKVDVSSLEAERDQVREQLRQVVGAKKKLAEMLDRLDVNDKHYDRKYQDMEADRHCRGIMNKQMKQPQIPEKGVDILISKIYPVGKLKFSFKQT